MVNSCMRTIETGECIPRNPRERTLYLSQIFGKIKSIASLDVMHYTIKEDRVIFRGYNDEYDIFGSLFPDGDLDIIIDPIEDM